MIWLRAAFGALAMGLALGAAGTASAALSGAPTWLERLLPALLCTTIAVLLIRPWRRRSQLGLAGGLRPFLIGVAVTAGSAVVMLGGGTALGWIEWGPLELSAALLFLLTNGVIAVLLEAFPEELTLRGYTYTTLGAAHRPLLTAVGTTFLFLLVPGLSNVIQSLLSSLIVSPRRRPAWLRPAKTPSATSSC